MSERRKYIKKANRSVVAIRLALETEGFTYEKWGGTQRCRAGDWLVDNEGDIYTVNADTFARTYRATENAGQYVKVTPIWAEVAGESGSVKTNEGVTHYEAGDYLVFNEEEGGDPYAVSAAKFASLYRPADG